MLSEILVKNFALIKEAHIELTDNLNILTGETGSGKSILIDSINIALGKRVSKDMLNSNNEDMIICLTFYENNKSILEFLKSMDIDVEDDGKIIIYRKITKDKTVNKINDINCTINKIKTISSMLIDIYGQHDSDELRNNEKQINFIDDYIGDEVIKLKQQIVNKKNELLNVKHQLDKYNIDERMKLREIDILKYEIEELIETDLKEGEEEELSEKYKLITNSKNLISDLYESKNILENTNIEKAIKYLKSAAKIDNVLNNDLKILYDIDSMITDVIKELDDKINDYDFDENDSNAILDRLERIRLVLSKYKNNIKNAKDSLVEKQNRLLFLENYDNEKNKLENKYDLLHNELLAICNQLTVLRKNKSKQFEKDLIDELKDLGFLDVSFSVEFSKKNEPTNNGIDDIVFMVSLNVGEEKKPLSEIASGGELSRIMLSIKTILSNNLGVKSLIFDEIDAGISGLTASKVAIKLNKISKNHQVICITHLPQIAAMADNHFKIEKKVIKEKTYTIFESLDEEGTLNEIGRLISSNTNLTKAVLDNAKELRLNAIKYK